MKIIHFEYDIEDENYNGEKTIRKVYLCNWACGSTTNKMTKDKSKVNCKNCIRKLLNVQNNNKNI